MNKITKDEAAVVYKDGVSVVFLNYLMLLGNYIFATIILRFGFDALYGHFVFLSNLQNFIIIFLGLGLQTSLLRSNIDASRFKKISAILHAAMQIILFVTTAIYLATQNFDLEIIPFAVLSYTTTWIAIVQPFYQWHEKMPQFQLMNMVLALIKVLFACALFISFTSHLQVFWCLATVALTYSVYAVYRSQLFSISSRADWSHILKEIWQLRSWPLWLSLGALAIYNRVTILILPLLGYKAAEIGNYGYSFSLLAAVLMLPGVLQMVLMRPLFSAKIVGHKLWSKVYLHYIVSGIIIGWLFSFIFPQVVNWAAGVRPELQEMLMGFAPSIPLVFIANLLGLALLSENRDKERTAAQVLAAIAILIAVLILVPKYGLVGAAYATTISYFVLYFSYVVLVVRHNCWGLRSSYVPFLLYGVLLLVAMKEPAFILIPIVVLPMFYVRRQVDSSNL